MKKRMAGLSAALVLAVLCLFAAEPTMSAQGLLNLQESDLPEGCGCRFSTAGEQSPSLVYWSWDEAKPLFVRDDKGLRQLPLLRQQYFPEKRTLPKFGDRAIVFFADARWQIQMIGSVESACAPREKKCALARYKARLLVQENGGPRQPYEGVAVCRCTP